MPAMPKASPEDESSSRASKSTAAEVVNSPPDQEDMSGVNKRLGQLEGQVENLSQRVAGLEEQEDVQMKNKSNSSQQSKKELKFNLGDVDEDTLLREEPTEGEGFKTRKTITIASAMREEPTEEKYKTLSRGSTGASVFQTASTDLARQGQKLERNETSKLSMASSVGCSSQASEHWDNHYTSSQTGSRGLQSAGLSYRTFNSISNLHPDALSLILQKRHTVLRQVEYARQVSLPLRILGIILAFLTIIFLWETVDFSADHFFPAKDKRLIFYLGVSAAAAFTLALSHHWIKVTIAAVHHADTLDDPSAGSLVPSFAYAISTLFLAVGTWGIMKTVVEIMVPEKSRLFCYGACGLFTLICTVIYAVLTRHNVLLDIASCATSLGLYDVDDDDGEA